MKRHDNRGIEMTGPRTPKQTTFKKDISLMEYPIYFLSEKQFKVQDVQKGKETYKAKVWAHGNYWFEAVAGIPSEYDYIILIFLLIQSQQNGFSTVIEISIRDILKGCGIDPGSAWYYKRVKTSLEVWERTRFHFEKKSFRYKEGDSQGGLETKFKELHAGIISNWSVIKGTTKLRISLDDQFVQMTRSSRFYKNIGFRDLKQLRGEPTAIRLHEILLKSFETTDTFEIGAKKLGTKLTIPDTYPSRIKAKVLAALEVINEKTSKTYTGEYLDKKSGCKIPKFIFRVVRKDAKSPPDEQKPPAKNPGNIFFQAQLPFGNKRRDIVKLVSDFYEYIIETRPDKTPSNLETEKTAAYDVIQDLNENDGYPMTTIQDVLLFIVSDPFWKNRVFTLLHLRETAENKNTTFQNMLNAFEGIRNPSSKTPEASTAGSTTWQQQSASAVANFLKDDQGESHE